jgi:hypothetical protein
MENLELQPRTKLDKGQRFGVGLLLCISVLLVAVSIFQFKSNIFSYGNRIKTDPLANLSSAERDDAEMAALKKADTDGDGLSDYNELYVYHSSPYMRDTDSDGIPDGEEVRKGTSPTCQEGKDCLFNPIAAVANASSTEAQAAPSADQTGGVVAPDQKVDLSALTPQELRDALVESGVPAAQLAGVSDEDLMKLVKQAQADNNAAPTTNP